MSMKPAQAYYDAVCTHAKIGWYVGCTTPVLMWTITNASSRSLRVLAAVLMISTGAWVEARQAQPSGGETTPAEKMGWWVRINPANQAHRVYWRFGPTPTQLSAP